MFALLYSHGDGDLHDQPRHHGRVFLVDIHEVLVRFALEDVKLGEHVHRVPDHPVYKEMSGIIIAIKID